MMSFEWPWVLLLAPMPWLHHFRRQPKSKTNAEAIVLPPVLDDCLTSMNDTSSLTLTPDRVIPWFCWLALLLAIAQPGRPGDSVAQPVSGRAMTLAVDLSGSMERKDFELEGQPANRLDVVKRIAGRFIEQRAGDRLSLVLFGKEAFIASPLTFDLPALRSTLDSAGIGMAGRSTAIGDALGLALQTLREDPAATKAIVLLSDGTNNSGSVEPESAATLAASMGIRIHAIALGSEQEADGAYGTAPSADLDESTLKQIAEHSDGEFFRADTSQKLESIYATIDTLERAEVEAPPIVVREDLRWMPLMALLVLLVLRSLMRRLP